MRNKDFENCLAELQHKNRVLCDRDVAYDRLYAEREKLRIALRRVLPMAEAWFRFAFDLVCYHEPGDCTCDQEAVAREALAAARAALGEVF
jgi:hypothetical protein